MSKIDKLVLLGALFLMVVIFAVSLGDKEDPYDAAPRNDTSYRGGRTSGALGAGDEQSAEAPRIGDKGFGDPVVRGEDEPAPSELHWEKPSTTGAIPEVRLPDEPKTASENVGPRDLAENTPSDWADPAASQGGKLDLQPAVSTPLKGVPSNADRESVLLASEAKPAPAQLDFPEGSILISVEGLERSQHADFRLYTWSENDTWASVAQRYYGDKSHAALLQQYNEDVSSLKANDLVYVPLYDVDERLVENENGDIEEEKVRPGDEGYVSSMTYAVVEGDSLWIIAKKALGEGARWRAIYDLNRDQLPDENALRPGMQLRLP